MEDDKSIMRKKQENMRNTCKNLTGELRGWGGHNEKLCAEYNILLKGVFGLWFMKLCASLC